jgi:hypothetical protein
VEERSELYWRKWFRDLDPPSPRQATLDVLEFAHYYPSTLRRFDLDSPGIEEVHRLYHAGHIHNIVYAPAFDSTETWLWASGRIRDGGRLRQIAGGIEQNSYFLACFAGDARGTEIFPPQASFAPEFVREHPEGARPADPILYFVVRAYSVERETIRWTETRPIFILDVVRTGPNDVGVLLFGSVRLDLHRPRDGAIEVRASTSGSIQIPLQRRAEAAKVDADAVVRRLFADSVFVLVASKPGLEVTGDFRDLREETARTWTPESSATAGSTP